MSRDENTSTLDTPTLDTATDENTATLDTATLDAAPFPMAHGVAQGTVTNPNPEPAFAPSGAERRRLMRDKAMARHATMVQATRFQAIDDKATRQAEGWLGREGYVEWTAEQRDAIREDLDGDLVTLTLKTLHATRRGVRCTVTGVTEAAGHAVAFRGEATVVDVADATTLDGALVTVKLTARRGATPKGTPFTGFTGESVGLASTGQRIGLKCRVQAARHVRVAASAL